MRYRVQRALHLENAIINIGDTILIVANKEEIVCDLNFITWLDEYTAALVTDKGQFSMNDIESIIKVYKA